MRNPHYPSVPPVQEGKSGTALTTIRDCRLIIRYNREHRDSGYADPSGTLSNDFHRNFKSFSMKGIYRERRQTSENNEDIS
jgi:hypothetical protein